jgi:hypothetical protein
MKSIFLYGEVDLPPIPSGLLFNLDFCSEEKFLPDVGFGQTFVKDNKLKTNTSYSKYSLINNQLIKWIKQTVPPWPEHESLTIQKSAPNNNLKDCLHPAHHDLRRIFALNYVLNAGGDSVVTSWYKDINQPILRNPNRPRGVLTDSGPMNYDTSICLGSAQFELHKWYLIRTNVLHDVDHIDHERSSITIPYFDESIVNDFKQKNLFKTIKEIEYTNENESRIL